jgi:hypothetical protein
MPLYERLTGRGMVAGETKIAVHTFISALGEVERGKATAANVISAFGLDATQQAELTTLVAKIKGLPESYPLGGFLTLTSVGSAYDSSTVGKGLGFVGLDTVGITRIDWQVRYNKIGAGTLFWQLWNEDLDGTNGAQILESAGDAVAGDNKILNMAFTPAQPLGSANKIVRPRVRNTTANVNPLYYGSTLIVRRVSMVTSEVLHELLLAAENQRQELPTLDTVAKLKTRLGV